MPTFLSPISKNSAGAFTLPEDGFIQVMPFGEWPGAIEFPGDVPAGIQNVETTEDGRKILRIVQILDREAAEQIAASFKPDTLIDYDHFADDPDAATRAAGWAEAIEVREDGVYCRIRWSADGLKDVTGGNYRFVSPVFPFTALQNIEGNRYRPRMMSGGALTNKPRLRGIHAVSNRDAALDDLPARAGSEAAAELPAGSENREESHMLEQIIQALGLPADATEEQVVAAIGEMKTTIDQMKAADLDKQVEKDLDDNAAKIENREAMKPILLKNREAGLAILAAVKLPVAGKVLNRADGSEPAMVIADPAKAEVAAARNREREDLIVATMKKYNLSTRAEAWSKAQTETPELFKN